MRTIHHASERAGRPLAGRIGDGRPLSDRTGTAAALGRLLAD